jgi:hypothetical protein
MEAIRAGYQAFTADGGEEFGAVREVADDRIIVYVENAGDFAVPMAAVKDVHSQKVIVDCSALDASLREAIAHAHDAEEPGL